MFRDRRGFWFGTCAVIAGVVLHRAAAPRDGGAVTIDVMNPTTLAFVVPGMAVGRFGIETRRRGLEEITAVELRKALEAG
jgi:hypothetical protein